MNGEPQVPLQCVDLPPSLPLESVESYLTQAYTWAESLEFQKSIELLTKAQHIYPLHFDVHLQLGYLYRRINQPYLAINCFNRAIDLQPLNRVPHLEKGAEYFRVGDFVRGANCNEWFYDQSVRRNRNLFIHPDGSFRTIHDVRIAVSTDSGLGDMIQYVRYAKLLKELGAYTIVDCQAELVNLLKNLDYIDEVIETGYVKNFHERIPVQFLIGAFGTQVSTIPCQEPYMVCNPEKALAWRAHLGDTSLKRVGLVWSSFSEYKDDRFRSIPLSELIKALPTQGFQYICLQKKIKEEDKAVLQSRPDILFVGNQIADFDDTAAIVDSLDLTISVDTSVLHLSAAMGKPTWILLPHACDHRWMMNREDSPWYPTAKLYRQSRMGVWDDVFESVLDNLMRF
jgi:ADP-heptose:LPS heptosyltransferase